MNEELMNRLNKTANDAMMGPAVQQQPQENPPNENPQDRIAAIVQQLQGEDPAYIRSVLEQEGLLGYVESAPEDREGAGSVSHNAAGEDKSASELMERLEKTANPEEGRLPRSFADEYMFGGGIPSYIGKEYNAFGVNDDDSHMAANTKSNAIFGGAGGAALGGALNSRAGYGAKGSLVGAGAGALVGGLGGAATGAVPGYFQDRNDQKTREKQEEEPEVKEANEMMDRLEKTAEESQKEKEEEKEEKEEEGEGKEDENNEKEQNEEKEQDKEASELMSRLEKTANPIAKGLSKAKDKVDDFTGKTYKTKNEQFNTQNSPEALERANQAGVPVSKFRNNLENLEKQKDTAKSNMNKTRGQAGLAAGAGAAGAGAAAASGNDDDQEKESSENEDFMNGLYKEAAATIIQESVPETKEYIDPIDRISFSK